MRLLQFLKSPNLAILTFTFSLSSCAFHSGIMTGNAAISDANFTVVGLATGTANTTHVLSFGGLGKEAIVLEAKRNMYNAYPLEPGQAFANISVDFKRGYYIIFRKTICTISADIIDFNIAPTIAAFDAFNAEVSGSKINSVSGFFVGEKVLYSNIVNARPQFRQATISSLSGSGASLRIESQTGSISHIDAGLENVYKTENDSTVHELDPIYRIGDTVYFRTETSFTDRKGVITAISFTKVAVEYENKGEVVPYNLYKSSIRTEKSLTMEQSKIEIHGTWALKSINEKPVVQDSKRPTINFDARALSVSGFGGCNNYFGSFTVHETGILISQIGATRMACLETNIESEYIKTIGNQLFKAKKYGNKLTLQGSKNTLTFELTD